MRETFANLKEIGSTLAALSVWGYVAGYLSLRAKAHALGTNPAFELVDEAYVFAGFKVVFVALIVLLLSAPILLPLDRGLAQVVGRLSVRLRHGLGWSVLAMAALLTIYNLRIFSCSSVLLGMAQPACSAELQAAITSGRGAVAWTFVATLLPILSVLALRVRLRSQSGPYEWLLGILTAVQLCLLPIYHGALFADRKVRVLSGKPSSLQTWVDPLGVVDHASDYVTLFGLDPHGERALVVVKQEDLNGVPVRRVISLSGFADELAAAQARARATPSYGTYLTNGADGRISKRSPKGSVQPTANGASQVSFLQQVVEVLRITFEAIGSLGESPVTSGELWEARVGAQGAVTRRRISDESDLAWPVGQAGSSAVVALRAGRLVNVSSTGEVQPHKQASVATWHKLLGVSAAGGILGFVVEQERVVPAILTPEGMLQRPVLEERPDDSNKLAKLLEESRSYEGKIALTVDRSTRGQSGFDVFLTRAGKRINISDCGDDSCAQASLAREPERILYVRMPRY